MCIKLKNKNGYNTKTIHIVVFNQCEMDYIKCHEGLEAKLVPMINCEHKDQVENRKRRKFDATRRAIENGILANIGNKKRSRRSPHIAKKITSNQLPRELYRRQTPFNYKSLYFGPKRRDYSAENDNVNLSEDLADATDGEEVNNVEDYSKPVKEVIHLSIHTKDPNAGPKLKAEENGDDENGSYPEDDDEDYYGTPIESESYEDLTSKEEHTEAETDNETNQDANPTLINNAGQVEASTGNDSQEDENASDTLNKNLKPQEDAKEELRETETEENELQNNEEEKPANKRELIEIDIKISPNGEKTKSITQGSSAEDENKTDDQAKEELDNKDDEPKEPSNDGDKEDKSNEQNNKDDEPEEPSNDGDKEDKSDEQNNKDDEPEEPSNDGDKDDKSNEQDNRDDEPEKPVNDDVKEDQSNETHNVQDEDADMPAEVNYDDVDKDQYNSDCPSVCPSRDIMVCARCKEGVYRTFLSVCHLRMFNCKHPQENLELVSRKPCILSAPFMNDMKTRGRVGEPHDEDKVLKYIRCRDKENKDDPACNHGSIRTKQSH